MKILNPNVGDKIIPIAKNNIYAKITDFGLKSFLREIKINPGQHSWHWIELKLDNCIDISETVNTGRSCSFEHSINRAVNDLYCTVYEFVDYDDFIANWTKIKYVESITTVYKSE